jgi:hypothetical protein
MSSMSRDGELLFVVFVPGELTANMSGEGFSAPLPVLRPHQDLP